MRFLHLQSAITGWIEWAQRLGLQVSYTQTQGTVLRVPTPYPLKYERITFCGNKEDVIFFNSQPSSLALPASRQNMMGEVSTKKRVAEYIINTNYILPTTRGPVAGWSRLPWPVGENTWPLRNQRGTRTRQVLGSNPSVVAKSLISKRGFHSPGRILERVSTPRANFLCFVLIFLRNIIIIFAVCFLLTSLFFLR